MDRRDLVLDLIALTGRSASSLADEIGKHRTGVCRWIKGGSGFPIPIGEKTQDELLGKLGVYRGTLSPDRVHFWTLKSGELSPLVRILSWASSGPFEMVYLAPGNLRKKKFLPDSDLLLAIYDSEKIRILFRRKPDPLNPDSEAIDSLVASGLVKWKNTVPDEISRIDPKIFDNLMTGKVSVEKYDRVWEVGQVPLTWEAFGAEMERRGLCPDDALARIDREKEEGR